MSARQYIDFDGSTYGSSPLMRPLTSPAFQGGLVLTIFSVAAKTLMAASGNMQSAFIGTLLFNLVWLFAAFLIAQLLFYAALPKNAAIDSSGYRGDPTLTKRMIAEYRDEARVILSIATALLVMNFSVFKDFDDPVPLFFLAHGLWAYFAGNKLSSGKWSVTTNPPVPDKKRSTVPSSRTQTASI